MNYFRYLILAAGVLQMGMACSVFAEEEAMKKADTVIGLFDGSPMWEEFKQAYEQVFTAKTIRAVNLGSDRGHKALRNIRIKFPIFEQTIDDLDTMFVILINDCLGILSRRPGRIERRSSYIELMQTRLKDLQIESRLMDTFIRENVKDAWVDAIIYQNMKTSLSAIIQHKEMLEKEVRENITVITEEDKKTIANALDAVAKAQLLVEKKEKLNIK